MNDLVGTWLARTNTVKIVIPLEAEIHRMHNREF